MTTANTFKSNPITFNAALDGEAPELHTMLFHVEFTAGRYLVYMVDLDDAGNEINSTPYRSFREFDAAVAWVREEEQKSIVSTVREVWDFCN